jgi:hypothetical protein
MGHIRDTGSRESTTGLSPKGLHGHPRLVRGVGVENGSEAGPQGLASLF